MKIVTATNAPDTGETKPAQTGFSLPSMVYTEVSANRSSVSSGVSTSLSWLPATARVGISTTATESP